MGNWGPIRFPDYSISQFAQPKQNFSFVVLYQLPLGMKEVEGKGALGQGIMGQLTRDQYPPVSVVTVDNTPEISNLLTISTRDFPDVNWGVTVITDSHFFNSQVRWSGRRTFSDSITITFREYVTSPITRILHNWQKLANDSVTNNIGYQNKYKGLIIKLEIDPNVFHKEKEMLDIEVLMKEIKNQTKLGFGEGGASSNSKLKDIVTRQVVFDGVWPQTISEPGNNYADTGTLQIVSSTFACDRYFEDLDWSRYLNDASPKTADALAQVK